MRFTIKWIARILLSPLIILVIMPAMLITLLIAVAIDDYDRWLEYWGFK